MVLLPCCKCCGASLLCQPAYTGSPGDCLSSGFEGKFYKNLKVELITEKPWTIKPYVLQKCQDEDLLESWYQPEYSEYYLPFNPSSFGVYQDSLEVQNPIGPSGDTIDIVRGNANLNCRPDPSFLLFSLSIMDMRYDNQKTPCHSPTTDWTNEFCDRCFNDTSAGDTWERRVRFDPATIEEQPDLLQRILEGKRVLLPAEAECRNTVWCTGGSPPCAPAINSTIAGYVTGYISVSMSCGPCWSCYRYNNNIEVYTANNNVFGPPDRATRIDNRCYETKEDAEEGCDGDYCCYFRNNGETEDDYQCVSKSDPAPPSGWRNTYQCTNDPDECVENCKPCWNLWRSPQLECREEDKYAWFESPLMEYLRYEPKPGFEDNVISNDSLEGIPEGTNIPVSLYSSNRCDYLAEYQSPVQAECVNPSSSLSMTNVYIGLEYPTYSDNIPLNRRTYQFETFGSFAFKSTNGACLRGTASRYQEFRQPLNDPHPKEFVMSFMVEDSATQQQQGEVFYKLTFRPGFTMYRYKCLTKEQPDPNLGEPDGRKTWEIISECNATQDDCEAATSTTTRGRTMPTTTTGPGTELASLLKWFGIKAKEKGCGCKSMQKKMDKNGAQWCRDHKEEILDHLAKEAKKRGLPFVKLAASKLLELAIRRAERGQ